jgi:asparagine synthase (glutamine-hydrolysing)
LSIDANFRFHPGANQCEKYLLRNAFSECNYRNSDGNALLPNEIIWRKKEAFSDGVSKTTRSLYEIIQEYLEKNIENMKISENLFCKLNNNYKNNPPQTLEQQYYRAVFEYYYPNLDNVVPYFWMPRYTNATDASARTLEFYNKPINSDSINNEI